MGTRQQQGKVDVRRPDRKAAALEKASGGRASGAVDAPAMVACVRH